MEKNQNPLRNYLINHHSSTVDKCYGIVLPSFIWGHKFKIVYLNKICKLKFWRHLYASTLTGMQWLATSHRVNNYDSIQIYRSERRPLWSRPKRLVLHWPPFSALLRKNISYKSLLLMYFSTLTVWSVELILSRNGSWW